MRPVILLFLLGISGVGYGQSPTPTPTAASTTRYTRPDPQTRRARYVKNMFGPLAIGKSVVSAGISTARNSPREWGPHWEGFGKRFASNMGRRIISNTVQFGLDEALKLDGHYYPATGRGVGARTTNAIASAFTERNVDGKRVVAIPRFVGTYSSNIIAKETWYPDRYSWKNGVRSGTVSLGMNVVFNLVKEFVHK